MTNPALLSVCNTTAAAPWTLVEPDALLYHGISTYEPPFAKHYFAPQPDARGGRATWESLTDGSIVRAIAAVSSPAPNPSADIPWVRLNTTATTPGYFANVEYVLRVNTAGGVASAAGDCNVEKTGQIVKVEYTADYVYFVKSSGTATSEAPQPTNTENGHRTKKDDDHVPATAAAAPTSAPTSGPIFSSAHQSALAGGISALLGVAGIAALAL